MIYLFDFQTCYKIGITSNIYKRFSSFKNARENVQLVNLIVNPKTTLDQEKEDKIIEKELHTLCKNFKISRELFQKNPEVLRIFSKYKIDIGDLKDWVKEFNPDNVNDKKNIIRKKVYQYDLKGNFIKEWNNANQASIDGFNPSKIYRVLNGERTKYKNYIWSYALLEGDTLKNVLEKANKYNTYNVKQYDLTGNFLKNYKSISEASSITGISQSSISLCCKGKYKTAGKYIWKKEE